MHSSMTASEGEIKLSNTYVFMWFLWPEMCVLAKGLLKLLHLKVIPFIVVYSWCYFSPSLWHGDKLPCPHKTYKTKLLFFIYRSCRLYRPISFTKFTTLLRGKQTEQKCQCAQSTLEQNSCNFLLKLNENLVHYLDVNCVQALFTI